MSQTITVIGSDCYALAAEFLGDATLFVQIMEMNGLSDPILTGQNTIIIPAIQGSASNGLPSE